MKILAVTDEIVERIYPLAASGHFADVELVLSCEDLPYPYLEYLVTMLNVPLCYVPGNHDPEFNPRQLNTRAEGCENVDGRVVRVRGLTVAGLGGSPRYHPQGGNQYSPSEMTRRAWRLALSLLWNRRRFGDLDILITHHRVSVAREQGREFIDAEIRECSTRVNITPDIKPDDLKILHEKVRFLERTRLDSLRPKARIRLTVPDGFDRMWEHIAVHRYFMGLEWKRHIDEDEAVIHWYDTVCLPIVKVIRASKIKEFPGKTEGDLYLWTLNHQRYLAEQEGQPLQPPEEAAQDFIDEVEP